MSIKVLLVDDQALVRAGFRMVLAAQHDIVVVGEAADGRVAVQATRRLQRDLVLMDIRMPVMDGIEATKELCRSGASTSADVLVLTTYDLDEYVLATLRAAPAGSSSNTPHLRRWWRRYGPLPPGDGLIAASETRRLIAEFARIPSGPRQPLKALERLTERERDLLEQRGEGRSAARRTTPPDPYP